MSSMEDVLQILKTSDFNRLIGQVEDEYLDFKSECYHLNDEKNKFELAKDVSSFANSKGGLIVLGVETERTEDHPTEKATKISLIKKNSFDNERYLKVINSWVYPDINVVISYAPSQDNIEEGLIYIYVQESTTTLRPYLVKKVIFEDSAKINGNAYAFFQRKASMNQPYQVEQMQRFFKDGMRYDEHLSDIHFLLSQKLADSNSPDMNLNEEIKNRLNKSILSCKLSDQMTYSLGFLPVPFADLTQMFEGRNSKIYQLIQRPQEIRSHGFDLDTGDNYSPKIVDGKLLRVCTSQFKLLDIWRDGGVFFTTKGNDFLCWASETKDYIRINQLALVESIYLFVSFVSEVYKEIKTKPTRYIFSVFLHNPTSDKYGLHRGALKHRELPFGPKNIFSKQEFFIEKQFDILDINKITYDLLVEIYLNFGHSIDAIPYIKKEDNYNIIDVEEIQSHR